MRLTSGWGPELAWGNFRVLVEKSVKLHILIVDDEALIRWSIGETLAHAGYDVSEAGNAKETLQRLSTGPVPDVILLDYRLPDSADLKLLETVRRLVPHSPVVMMTAYGSPAMQAGALALGAHRVVSKPVEMRDVLPLVQEAYASRPQ
jgi:DNA-binding NtrC family response regulator